VPTPTRVRPVRWRAPRAPARSRQLTGGHLLPPVGRLELPGAGPEDVVVDGRGRLLAGLEDGRILRVSADGRRIDTLADTGGRPLGLESLPDGALVICDEQRGLLRLDPEAGDLTVLVDAVAGSPLTFCSNAVAAADGTLYFSASSSRFGLADYRLDLIEHSGTGQLLRRSPEGGVEVLLQDLQFANGVALAPDESFVVVAETGAYRLTRLWLSGPRAGRREVLVDNLPGFPDNISVGSDGIIWVTLASPRDPVLDLLHRRNPAFLRLLSKLPERLQPAAKRTVWVLGVEAGPDGGRIAHDLQAPGDNFHFVTGVVEHEGVLYLGSLLERAIGVLPLP
jgi:sugar lactone lactonase YvrE